MIRGLPASILLHGALVMGGSIAWPYIAPERAIEEFVPVELDIQLDLVTNFAPIVRRNIEPDLPEPEPEEEPLIEEIEDAEEDAEEVELAEDELDTTDVRELEATENKEETAAIADEADELEEPDADDEELAEADGREPDPLADLLAESDKLFSEVKTTERKPVVKQEKKILVDETKVEAPRKGVGDRTKETARIEAMIASQMKVCWDDVIDLPNPERLNVEIRVSLTDSGALERDVELLVPRRPPVGDRPMGVAIERALRAARKCAPYRLPKDALSSYDEWKVINFRIGKGFGQ